MPNKDETVTDITVTAPVANLTVAAATRSITGTILTYEEIGTPSSGETVFSAGSLEFPEDLSRVKLLVQHDSYAAAVGYLTDYEDNGGTVLATFHLADTPEADKVISEMKAGTRDGLSVGVSLNSYSWQGDNAEIMRVESALLREVSIVTIPAYQSAKVLQINAAHAADTGETKMSTNVQADKQAAATGSVTETVASSSEPVTVAAPAAITAPRASGVTGLTAKSATLATVNAMFTNVLRAGGDPGQVAAALSQLNVPAVDPGQAYIRPTFIGELWQATTAGRPWFDGAASVGNITSMGQIQGFQRVRTEKPTVAEYDGNYADVPSGGGIKTKQITADVVRRAGALAVDRIMFDLDSGEFIKDLLIAMADEYKRETEEYIVGKLVEAATPVEKKTNLVDTLTALGVEAGKIGSKIHRVELAPDKWEEFVMLKSNQVPWWLQKQGEVNLNDTSGYAGGIEFSVNPSFEAGQILAGDNRAYKPFERASLIDVQAANIGNGSIELGVFGYISLIINDPRALFKVTA